MRETVCALVRGIQRGKVSTYAAIARKAGTSARAVGSILHANRDPSVPCHRVVRSDGSVGGYNRGAEQKIRILEGEGVLVKKGKISASFVFRF